MIFSTVLFRTFPQHLKSLPVQSLASLFVSFSCRVCSIQFKYSQKQVNCISLISMPERYDSHLLHCSTTRNNSDSFMILASLCFAVSKLNFSVACSDLRCKLIYRIEQFRQLFQRAVFLSKPLQLSHCLIE